MTRANFTGMRLLCAVTLAGLCCLTAKAEDWTVNGKTYHNVVAGEVEADRVHFKADDGIGSFMLADLPPDLQKRFNYDPLKAKAANEKKEKELADAAKQDQAAATVAASLSKAQVRVIQVTPDGFLGVVFTKWGASNPGFVKGDTKGMIDGGLWAGFLMKAGTFSYTDTEGSLRTVSQFVIAPNTTSSFSDQPAVPRAPVSSLQSVGGG